MNEPPSRWLATMWPVVRMHLPPPPAFVVEIGCGRLGGFVPGLGESGYEAVGVDPAAPEGDGYRQTDFEHSALAREPDAVIACTSLHHVADPGQVLDKVLSDLAPGGRVIVVEWDWESFDETTARWCFDRLASSGGEGWLRRRQDEWMASGQPWEDYFHAWASQHGLHSARRILGELDGRFQRLLCRRAPYFFSELSETTEAEELEAINLAGIQAARIDYVGQAP